MIDESGFVKSRNITRYAPLNLLVGTSLDIHHPPSIDEGDLDRLMSQPPSLENEIDRTQWNRGSPT